MQHRPPKTKGPYFTAPSVFYAFLTVPRHPSQLLHLKSGISFVSVRIGTSPKAPVVASFSCGDVCDWLVSRGYNSSHEDAQARLDGWVEQRVFERVGGSLASGDDSALTILSSHSTALYDAAMSTGGSSTSAGTLAGSSTAKASGKSAAQGGGHTMSEDLRSRLYRFVDPWEVEALSPGAPNDCAGYIGRCSYEPVLAGAVVDVLMSQEGWNDSSNGIDNGSTGEVGGLSAPSAAAGGGLISKVGLRLTMPHTHTHTHTHRDITHAKQSTHPVMEGRHVSALATRGRRRLLDVAEAGRHIAASHDTRARGGYHGGATYPHRGRGLDHGRHSRRGGIGAGLGGGGWGRQ